MIYVQTDYKKVNTMLESKFWKMSQKPRNRRHLVPCNDDKVLKYLPDPKQQWVLPDDSAPQVCLNT